MMKGLFKIPLSVFMLVEYFIKFKHLFTTVAGVLHDGMELKDDTPDILDDHNSNRMKLM